MPRRYRYRRLALRAGQVVHDETVAQEFLTREDFLAAIENWNRAWQHRGQTGIALQWVYAPVGVELPRAAEV